MTAADLSDRLALSRERIRQAMQGTPAPRSGEAFGAHAAGTPIPWLDSLKSLPMAGVVIDAVSSWWAQHPLRLGVIVASSVAKVLVQPVAQRNPLGLVLGALLLGGLVVWSRPWRWLLKPALFAGLLPQLLDKTLARLPSQPRPPASHPASPPAPTSPVLAQPIRVQPSANRSNSA